MNSAWPILSFVLALASCANEGAQELVFASAVLASGSSTTDTSSGMRVEISFEHAGDRTTATLTASGCPEGAHEVHIHAGARCGAAGSAAGPRWMPAGPTKKHGGGEQHQDSSLGRIYCKADGTSRYIFITEAWELGAGTRFDPVGHAIVLYSVDGTERIACGLIELD